MSRGVVGIEVGERVHRRGRRSCARTGVDSSHRDGPSPTPWASASGLQSLGIIVDANGDVFQRWTAIKNRVLDANHPESAPFVSWFQRLFSN